MSARRGLRLDTLSNLLKGNGHHLRKIFYLKVNILLSQNMLQENMQVDIEGAELETLPQWVESGILQSVHQLGIELHLAEVHQVHIALKWNQ